MLEIGETLREARMRRRVDITEVEIATKIRAKYLRALENEEWELLPGPTFVKTFLRTYAEYLGLDARTLVEEYRLRYERPGPQELMPITPPGLRSRRRPPRGGPPPVVVVLGVLLVLLGLLFVIGTLWPTGDGGDDERSSAARTPTATPAGRGAAPAAQPRRRKKPAARVVRMRILPQGKVNVCLVDAQGRRRIDNVDLVAGGRTREFRSRRFRLSLGNGLARIRIVGRRTYDVPDRARPIGLDIRPGRAPRELPAGRGPRCP